MRIAALAVVVTLAAGARVTGQSPAPPSPPKTAGAAAPAPAAPLRPVGTMSELMVHLIRPTSDAVFYITSRTPTTEAEWVALQAQTLTLAEAGNLLLLPAHARGRAQWIADARLMLEAGKKAFTAAKAKDLAALEALNDEMYESCLSCHTHFRAGYGKRPGR